MKDKVAIISNIHGNLEASKSVLEEIRNEKYRDMEKIYRSFELRGINKDDI